MRARKWNKIENEQSVLSKIMCSRFKHSDKLGSQFSRYIIDNRETECVHKIYFLENLFPDVIFKMCQSNASRMLISRIQW